MTIHISCSTFNGLAFVRPFVESLQRQSVRDWRLWIRDNGSADETPKLIDALCAADPRIAIVDGSREPLPVVASFARLFERVPADAEYLILADQDDIWLDDKLEVTLNAMQEAERVSQGPVLAHTDLTVVNAELKEIAPSFWMHNGIDHTRTSLRQVAVRNVVTAGTAMVNRALRECARMIPAGAAMHDWWLAMVAAEFGRIVAVERSTVLYRQHGANVIGAQRPLSSLAFRELMAAVPQIARRTSRLRRDIAAGARQAQLFLDHFGDRLKPSDRAFLASYAQIPSRSFFARKAGLLRLQAVPGNSVLHTLGILLRG